MSSKRKTSQINKKRNRKAGNSSTRSDEHYMVRVRPREPLYLGPPTYKQQVLRSWRLRFDVAGNAAFQNLTPAHLGGLLGVIATSAATSVFITQSFRLRAVHLWSWTDTIGTTVDIGLKLADTATAGGQGGPPCSIGDSSASLDKPAYVGLMLPEDSIFARWQSVTAATNMLSYFSPKQGVMDLIFEFFIDDVGALTAGPALAAATLGNIYHKSVGTLTAVAPLNGI